MCSLEGACDMDKDFLTYNQQMKLLRNHKKIACNGTSDKILLCRSGYFNLVNGYKTPFTTGKDAAGNHVYFPGTTIHHLGVLKEFDDDLRLLLLRYITKAEEEVRAFAAYKFDEVNNKGTTQWYQVDAYNPRTDVKRIIALISKAYSEISRSDLEYVKFYMDNHKVIPTWILTKIVYFATFIDFLNFSKDPVKDSICELYSIKDSRGYSDYKLLIASLHWLRKIRNACAHNERIYSLSGKTKNGSNKRITDSYFLMLPSSYSRGDMVIRIIDLFVYLKYFLETNDYTCMMQQISDLLNFLRTEIPPPAFDRVRATMGIKDVSHLAILMTNPKTIEYNKF